MGYSPIVKVKYDTVGNNFSGATDLGEISDQSSHEPSTNEDNVNTRQETMYAGYMENYTIQCYDTSKHATLKTAFANDERRDFQFEKEDGTTVDVLDAKVQVGPVFNATSAGNRDYFQLIVKKFVT